MRIKEKPLNEYPFIARIIFWAQKKKYGDALLPSKLWGRSPKLLYGLQAFYRALDRKSSPLPPALRSIINVMVSQINHCSFCTDISSNLLQKSGVSMDKILELKNFETSTFYSEKERSALAYAQAMTKAESGVTNSIFERLSKNFSDDEIIELTAVISYQNLSSKFNSALDVPAQGFCLPQTQKEKTL